jgi:hypothetical protein
MMHQENRVTDPVFEAFTVNLEIQNYKAKNVVQIMGQLLFTCGKPSEADYHPYRMGIFLHLQIAYER